MNTIQIIPEKYQQTKPYPYYVQDHILDPQFAQAIQEEIVNLSPSLFDRYENPFEQKFTLRDKSLYPPQLNKLFSFLESEAFMNDLSRWVGYKLILDPTRNFHGVHIYNNQDKLDIHVDAGIHPVNQLKKQVTLGIYLSKNWKEDYGCDLEIWAGSDSSKPFPKLYHCVTKIAPIFNRLVLFTCTDDSWHGNPEPVNSPEHDTKRIFVTLSYLSEETHFENKRTKAYFIARPNDLHDPEKDRLRELRAHPEEYKQVYRTNK